MRYDFIDPVHEETRDLEGGLDSRLDACGRSGRARRRYRHAAQSRNVSSNAEASLRI